MSESVLPAGCRYWAFISYSHADEAWARWLHRALENYRLPKDVIDTDARGVKLPVRLFPVFRDRDEFGSASSLTQAIEEALRVSHCLIVVCSPRASASRWVTEEIKAFKALGRPDAVLCLIVDGEPNAVDDPDRECFPAPIRFRVTPERMVTDEPEEPLAADVRPSGDGRTLARLKLVAGILRLGLDTLRRRDEARQRRRNLIVGSVLGFLVFVFAVLALYANAQRQTAEAQRELAIAGRLAAESRLADNPDAALLLAAQATVHRPTLQARGALLRALLARPQLHSTVAELPISPVVLAYAPDGLRIAVGGGDGGVALVDPMDAGAVVRALPTGTESITAIGFGNGHRILAAGDATGQLWLWQVHEPDDAGRQFKAASTEITSLAVSADGSLVAVGDVAGAISVWTRKGVLHSRVAASGKGSVTDLDFNREGTQLAYASAGLVALWDVTAGRSIPPSLDVPEAHSTRLRFLVDGSLVLCSARSVGRWTPVSGALRFVPQAPERFLSCTISADGQWAALISADNERGVVLLDTAKAQVDDKVPAIPISWEANTLSLSPDGSVLVLPDRHRRLRLWQPRATTPFSREVASQPRGRMWGVALHPDGERFATVSADGTAQLWNLATGTPLGPPLRVHDAEAVTATFSVDGRILATGGFDGYVALMDVDSREVARIRLPGEPTSVSGVAFLPDARTLVAADSDRSVIHVLDAHSRTFIGSPHPGPDDNLMAIALSPDGRLLASGGNRGGVAVWDMSSRTLRGHATRANGEMVWSLAFGGEVPLLAIGRQTTIELKDLSANPRSSQELPWQGKAGVQLAFSPDARVLAASSGGEIVLWDVATRQPLGTSLEGAAGSITQLVFSRDGRTLLSSHERGRAIAWNLDAEDWRNLACRIAGRNLSCEEWARHVGEAPYGRTCPLRPAPAKCGGHEQR